ncbi:MAG: hypothetical protein JXB06_08735 [Spirochaetales bacterium]|nr:hypothetical protein [Spirochaetales bacterium]
MSNTDYIRWLESLSNEDVPSVGGKNASLGEMIRELIQAAHRHGTKVGICGQAPSDHSDFAAFLVQAEIDSMSLNPDSVLDVIQKVHKVEEEMN